EEEKALGAARDLVDDRRQVDKVVLLHLDETQALAGVLVQQALHDRRLAGAARAGQEHVVRRLAVDELPRVLLDALDLLVDAAQVGEPDAVHMPHRLQPPRGTAPARRAPAEGDARLPVGLGRRRRQELFQPRQDFLEFFAQVRYSALIFT